MFAVYLLRIRRASGGWGKKGPGLERNASNQKGRGVETLERAGGVASMQALGSYHKDTERVKCLVPGIPNT
jgi:hypothetical protein